MAAVPQVDTDCKEEIKKAEQELKNLILEKKFSAPDLLRLAYASQFSIANSPANGAGPSTKKTPSAKHKTEIETIKVNHPITYPDLYQLAGTVALEAFEDGPKIKFAPGRKDLSISPDESCLPDVKKSPSDLRGVFAKVGISDPKHIVALCGGLKLASSGVQNPKFDNSYFVDLYKNKDSSPTDKALLDDTQFRDCVQHYAEDNEAFIKDYKEAHKKLSEFGLEKSMSPLNNLVGQKAVGVAVAAVVVILSVFYLIIHRRRAKHSSPQFQ